MVDHLVRPQQMKTAYVQKLLSSPLHCGVNVRRFADWQPRSTVPKSFDEKLKQFGDQYGVELRLEWDGFGRFFVVMQKSREWDSDEEKYLLKDAHVFDLVRPDGQPIKAADFGEYILDLIAEFHQGYTIEAKKAYKAKLKEARASIKADEDTKLAEEGLEIIEEVNRSQFDGESVEKMLDRDKIHSLGANSKADSSKGEAARTRRGKGNERRKTAN